MTLTIDATTIIRTTTIPLVERGDDEDADRYVLTLPDADVGIVLTMVQLDALISRALASKMLDPDEEDDRD